ARTRRIRERRPQRLRARTSIRLGSDAGAPTRAAGQSARGAHDAGRTAVRGRLSLWVSETGSVPHLRADEAGGRGRNRSFRRESGAVTASRQDENSAASESVDVLI